MKTMKSSIIKTVIVLAVLAIVGFIVLPTVEAASKTCTRCKGEGTLTVKCGWCNGKGKSTDTCQTCYGSGKQPQEGMFKPLFDAKCKSCKGKGKATYFCQSCSGTGKVKEKCNVCDGRGTI